MDLSELLDVTESVECEFLGKKITAHVFTAGMDRLTKEDREILKQLNNRVAVDLPDLTEEEMAALTEEERKEREVKQWQQYAGNVDALRVLLPFALKGWDLDGTPMELRGQPLPPTADNLKTCPDPLLLAVGGVVVPRWSKPNPTNGGPPPTGSQAEESPKDQNLPAENTLLENNSPSPQGG